MRRLGLSLYALSQGLRKAIWIDPEKSVLGRRALYISFMPVPVRGRIRGFVPNEGMLSPCPSLKYHVDLDSFQNAWIFP